MRRLIMAAVCLFGLGIVRAQDGLNLPTELYVLLNEGVIDRYGLGAAGVERVTVDDAFVLDFQVAPDGNWLAYRTPEGLFMQQMYRDDLPRQIESATADVPLIRGRGETLAWSPGADALAYTTTYGGRVYFMEQGETDETGRFVDLPVTDLLHLSWSPDGRYLAAEADNNIWWVFRREANEMVLTSAIPQAFGVDWFSPTQLVFPPPEGGLRLMDLAAGNAQTAILDPARTYRLPYARRDGSVMVFVTLGDDPNQGQLLRLIFGESGIVIEEAGIEPVDLAGVRWAPGGGLLIALQGGALALVNPTTAQGFTLPMSAVSAYGWGPPQPPITDSFMLPQTAHAIAPDASGVAQVWRIPSDGSRPQTITPAETDIISYALSPDGRRIAYISDDRLWLHTPGSSTAPTELLSLGPNAAGSIAFGPNGGQIYYRDVQGDAAGIWRAGTDADDPELFVPDQPGVVFSQPQPSSGVQAILVQTEEASGDVGFAIFNTVTGDRLTFIRYGTAQTTAQALQPRWLGASDVAFAGVYPRGNLPVRGLHVLDVNNVDEPPFTLLVLNDTEQVLDLTRRDANTLRVITRQRDPGRIRVLQIDASGDVPSVLNSPGYLTTPRLSPDGSLIIGLTHNAGLPVRYNIAEDDSLALSGLNGARALQWR